MAQLPLGGVYVPPVNNAPPNFLTASTANNQRLLDAWTGTPTSLYGCTFYLSTQGGAAAWRGGSITATLDTILATAQSNGLNMVRVTDFFDNSTISQRWDDPVIWTNIDYLVSAAQLRNMYVLMDVSAWKKWMLSQGGTGSFDPSVAANWTPLLQALANHYQNAKNICWYSIIGEPVPPVDSTTLAALLAFYQGVTDTLAAADTNHLVSAGGFNRMEEHQELMWWQQIYALPHNHVCAFKTYSQDDLDLTNFIGRYVATIGKPLANEEFGAEQLLGDTVYSGTPWNGVVYSMSDYYRQVYRRGAEAGATTFIFWNLGFQSLSTGFDISPSVMPGTWAVVNEAATGNSPIKLTVNNVALDSNTFASAGSIAINSSVGQRTTADLTLIDVNGVQHYEQGEPVVITDDFNVKLFAGTIESSTETLAGQTALLEHAIACSDWHRIADKRAFPYSNANVSLATIVKDMVTQVLAAEGVTAAFGGNALSPNQSNGGEEDLQGFDQQNNAVLSQDPTQICPLAGGLGGSLKCVASGAQGFQAMEARIPIQTIPGAAGAAITISAYMKASTGTPTLRFYVQGAASGLGAGTTVTLSTTWTRYTWTATMPNPIVGGFLALRVDTNTPAQAVTWWMDGLQVELGASATAWQLGGSPTVQAGPTIVEFVSNYATCAAGLDALSQAANFVWQIDANKVLWCGAQGMQLAPWSVGEGDILRGTSQVQHSNPLYRNRQYILGALDQTTTQIETRQGDGTTTAFTMSYALAKVPTVTLNGAAQTIGIGGVDTGKNWYWNAGMNTISQDTTSTPPLNAVYQTLVATGATAGTFTLSYKGVATANINWNDTAATVQTRLTALTTVGASNALVTGGPLPGTQLLITFAAALAHDGTQVAVGTNALTGGTPTLATVAPLSVTYVGQYPIVVLSTNDAEITAQLAREAGVGTGYVEDATGVAGIKTRAGAYQTASGYIAKFAQVGRTLTFHTYRGGILPGQLLSVNLPDYALAGEQMFVQSVTAQHDGLLHFDYAVTAIEGPINATWVQYFGALASRGPTLVDSINLGGAGTTLALLQTFTGTKAPSATFVATATACPIFPLTFPVTFC